MHDLAWGTGRLSKSFLPACEPFRLNRVVFDIRKRLFVAFDEKGDGQHVTIDGLVSNSFACFTLYIGEE